MSDETAAYTADAAERIEREADEDDDLARRAGDLDLEAPEADSAEQRTELLPRGDDPVAERPADRDGEANPADTAEQRRAAGAGDEDDEEAYGSRP
jgi:hypothetical protein